MHRVPPSEIHPLNSLPCTAQPELVNRRKLTIMYMEHRNRISALLCFNLRINHNAIGTGEKMRKCFTFSLVCRSSSTKISNSKNSSKSYKSLKGYCNDARKYWNNRYLEKQLAQRVMHPRGCILLYFRESLGVGTARRDRGSYERRGRESMASAGNGNEINNTKNPRCN